MYNSNAMITNTQRPPLTQLGDKNTAVAHADSVVINNIIQVSSQMSVESTKMPDSISYVIPAIDTSIPVIYTTVNTEYYNLIVTFGEIRNNRVLISRERCLKGYSKVADEFADLSTDSISKIKTFPSLIMNENTNYDEKTDPNQEAYFGYIKDVKILNKNDVLIYFSSDIRINQQAINDISRYLNISGGRGVTELCNTHWNIKNINLIEELILAELLPNNYGQITA